MQATTRSVTFNIETLSPYIIIPNTLTARGITADPKGIRKLSFTPLYSIRQKSNEPSNSDKTEAIVGQKLVYPAVNGNKAIPTICNNIAPVKRNTVTSDILSLCSV